MPRPSALSNRDKRLVRQIRAAAEQSIQERELAVRALEAQQARLAQEMRDIRRMASFRTIAEGYGVSHMTIRRVIEPT